MPEAMKPLAFRLMSFLMKLVKGKKFVNEILDASLIKNGDVILDYACGPGIFTIPAARLVGGAGHVFAADIHPLAIEAVSKAAVKHGLENITTILTDCDTSLETGSVDAIFLFDCFHHFREPDDLLGELHRVLKERGRISLEVDHGSISPVESRIVKTGLFEVFQADEPRQRLKKHVLFSKI
ncbi:MAG: class I SAM-dependent methyltransferase [Promethearchaeota archaeon]